MIRRLDFILFSIFLLLTILAIFSNQYNNIYYVLFSILSISLLRISFNKNSNYFEKFFGIFIFLGFWFKFSSTLILNTVTNFFFRNYEITLRFLPELPENFIIKSEDINRTILISCFAILIIIFNFMLRQKLFSNSFKLKKTNLNNLEIFYLNYRKYILLFLIFFIAALSFLNLNFFIYQKGIEPVLQTNFLILNLFKWLFQFGIASFVCLCIYYDLKNKISLTTNVMLFVYQAFLLNLSFISRSMLLECLVVFLILFFLGRHSKYKINFKKLIFILIFSVCLFFVNYKMVNNARDCLYTANKVSGLKIKVFNCDQVLEQNLNNKEKSKSFIDTSKLILNMGIIRWVGFDALVAVAKYPNLNLKVHLESFKEKYDKNIYSFYETKFLNKIDRKEKNIIGDSNLVLLPGLVAFSYYSGSLIVMSLFITASIVLANLIEYISLRLTNFNLIFAGYLSFILSFRLVNFGHIPINTIYYILVIIFNILLFFVINKLVKYATKR